MSRLIKNSLFDAKPTLDLSLLRDCSPIVPHVPAYACRTQTGGPSKFNRSDIVFPQPIKTTTRQVRSQSDFCVVVFIEVAEEEK
jgi:hypothetical protein